MEWLNLMNRALDYIEGNLEYDISLEEAARAACCSSYHFQRMFSFITGVTLAEYIRRRRLTMAALDLQNGQVRVIDLAVKYGYDSPDAFSRAFQKLHGVTPSAARESGVKLKAFPRISFHISVRGDKEMDYRIIERDPFSVFGAETVVSAIDGKCYRDIPIFWDRCIQDGTASRIIEAAGGDENMLINAALYAHSPEDGTFRYMMCAPLPEGKVPGEFKVLNVPSMTWAVFATEEHEADEGTELIQEIWKKIYSEWFPTSGYEHADGPEFEFYQRKGRDKFIGEVWIPIIKK